MMTPLQAILGVSRNLPPKMVRLVCKLMRIPIEDQRRPMAGMVPLSQAMPPRKSGVTPAMALPKMGLPKMVPLIMVPPIMVQKIAQTCLRRSLPKRFRVIKMVINLPNRCVFAWPAAPEMRLKTCDPHGNRVAFGMI
jgi:hypothetical protein